jgi:hypothetical protein
MSIEEEVFDNHYEITMKHLQQLSGKEGFDIHQIKGELLTLTKYEGLDWTGRGGIKEAEISGAILAYQAFIMRWEGKNQRTGTERIYYRSSINSSCLPLTASRISSTTRSRSFGRLTISIDPVFIVKTELSL